MAIQEYVVREQDGLWEVWLGDQLLSGQPTRTEALRVAEAIAHAAAARGEAAKVLVGSLDGEPIEYPIPPEANGTTDLRRALRSACRPQ